MKLYLIRHGETDFNRQGIVQGGGVDSDLNDMGRQQALAFFKAYAHLKFEAVYASALKRTHQTLAPWLENHSYKLQTSPAINEFSWGWMEGKRPDKKMQAEFYALKEAWNQGNFDKGIEGGESPNSAWARIKPFFDELHQKHLDQQVLVCAHGRTNRIILTQLLGLGMERMGDFDHSNTGLNILQFDSDGKVSAETINHTGHLETINI
jgi:probable phosphoglycerate mutase